jgi:hypothetical protein
MSARYDAPGTRDAADRADAPGGQGSGGGQPHQLDAATMWESLNGGEDPTEDPTEDDPAEKTPPPARTAS